MNTYEYLKFNDLHVLHHLDNATSDIAAFTAQEDQEDFTSSNPLV